jgi:DNA-binding response OmpR family regulator
MTRVLVIDDEPQIMRALRINLSVRGYKFTTAATGAEALRSAADHRPMSSCWIWAYLTCPGSRCWPGCAAG